VAIAPVDDLVERRHVSISGDNGSPAACRLPDADAAAGKSVLARTLTLLARLVAASSRYAARGSKRSSYLATTRTRWRKTRGGVAPPDFRLRSTSAWHTRPSVGMPLLIEGTGMSADADLRSPPRHCAAETCPQRGFRVDFRPRAPVRAKYHWRSDCATRTPPRTTP